MPSVGVPLPPPFKGQNDLLPTFSLENPYCSRLQNFNNDNGIINLRKGNQRFAQTTTDSPNALYIAAYGSQLFMLVDDTSAKLRFYEITTGTPVSVYTTGVGIGGDDEIQILYFNGYLMWFGEASLASAPVYYNGSTWGTLGYTFSFSFPFGGATHKNRAYIIARNNTKYAYSGVDAISGATTTVDLASVFSDKAYLYGIKSISLSENVTQENVAAFISSTGEILVYSGSYPNSDTWTLSARLRISPPIFINSAIDAKGDSFILTRSEIISLRGVIARGYDAERKEGIGASISNRWKQIVNALINNYFGNAWYFRGIYDDQKDRLVISIPYYVHPITGLITTGLFQLVYDFDLGAWYEYVQFPNDALAWANVSAAYWDGKTCILTGAVDLVNDYATTHVIDVQTDYLDQGLKSGTRGIDYQLTSAPHPLNRYGVVKADGLEVIMKSDIYATAKWRLIGDLGAQQTSQQITSGNGSNVTKAFVNLGIESNLVQYDLSGTSTSSSVGLEIYGTNLWVNPSQGVAR